MSQAMEKLRKKTIYKPEYGGSCFYCSTFEKILNRLLKEKTVYNRYYETSVTFFQAIRGFFLEEIPKTSPICTAWT
ncbi:hypothetical protein [Candidatus Rhabdochlamydia sp. W815]|uniref:hypothetical protein n=1 Tax=Candidatus Rhabdochlamydia sp. W815 TaxID=2720721 RepID=UPI001BFCC55C|nr:hypothetical protein [Candidatus Rhabdochlamydia sp. W815]